MFKALTIYRITQPFILTLEAAEEAVCGVLFIPCTPSQEHSIGFAPPRGEANGAVVESVGGQWILRFMSEIKKIPAQVLQRRVDEKAEAIEDEYGRKPGKKERRDLKDEAWLDLLPSAFASRAATLVWIDPTNHMLAIDTASQSRADEIVTALVRTLPGLSVSLLDTKVSPQAAMAIWLKDQESPAGFTIDRECELKSTNEDKSVVRYGNHPLDIAEVQAHIAEGKLPTKLALTWNDRVSFVLTHGLQLCKLSFLDTVVDDYDFDDAGFDADVAIATGELSGLLVDLIDALGGEVENHG